MLLSYQSTVLPYLRTGNCQGNDGLISDKPNRTEPDGGMLMAEWRWKNADAGLTQLTDDKNSIRYGDARHSFRH